MAVQLVGIILAPVMERTHQMEKVKLWSLCIEDELLLGELTF